TSVPGVFVAGDVRKGSVKRLAVATGEGAAAVNLVHRYLAETYGREATDGPHAPSASTNARVAARPHR
ncbi:MAG: hypothetical protein ACJ78L_05050, partial [Chloroflexota bacterium]